MQCTNRFYLLHSCQELNVKALIKCENCFYKFMWNYLLLTVTGPIISDDILIIEFHVQIGCQPYEVEIVSERNEPICPVFQFNWDIQQFVPK